ncbi:MAG: branched-chain amino acid ABC transporter permease, partial [Proteobacteria bacterium]|nr:branched-chain amino acid ABC transporter permease [Pseudomonadota bacterium]
MHSNVGPSTYRGLAVLWVLLISVPWLAPNNYILNLGTLFLTNLLLVASLNLLMGYSGQISLAHAAFYGLGAYVSGVLGAKYGVSPWLGTPAALVSAGLVALLVGWPTLRLRGHYLAMATLGFNAIASVLFVELHNLTGGPNGLVNIPPYVLFGWSLAPDRVFFYFTLLVVGACLVLLLNLLDSRAGRALRALSTAEIGAECMGIDVHRHKILVFMVSAMIAALAGCLYAHHNAFVSPESFDFITSTLLVVMVALGGTGHWWGAFFGALVFTALPELLRSFGDLEMLVFGVSLVLVMLFFPRGLGGGLDWMLARFGRRGSAGRTP